MNMDFNGEQDRQTPEQADTAAAETWPVWGGAPLFPGEPDTSRGGFGEPQGGFGIPLEEAAVPEKRQETPVPAQQQLSGDALAGVMGKLEELSARLGAWEQAGPRAQAAQEDASAARLAALETMAGQLQACQQRIQTLLEAQQSRTESLQTAMAALESRCMDVLRKNMEFTSESARRWTRELEDYRSMFKETVFDGLLEGLADIYADTLTYLRRHGNDPELRDHLSYCVLEPVRDLLEEHGVELVTTAVGARRSLRGSKARSVLPTGDPARNGTVACSLLPGFLRDGKFWIRQEQVQSYAYREGYTDPGETPAPSAGQSAREAPDGEDAPGNAAPEDAAQPVPPAELPGGDPAAAREETAENTPGAETRPEDLSE